MDTTLYEELSRSSTSPPTGGGKIRPITLFHHVDVKIEQPLDGLLSTVDLGLPSPDLDRFLLQDVDLAAELAWSVPPIPTPIDLGPGVTEEQEAYARGFVDALEELHKKKGSASYSVESPTTSFQNSCQTFGSGSQQTSSNSYSGYMPNGSSNGIHKTCMNPNNYTTTQSNFRPKSESNVNAQSSFAFCSTSGSTIHHMFPGRTPVLPAYPHSSSHHSTYQNNPSIQSSVQYNNRSTIQSLRDPANSAVCIPPTNQRLHQLKEEPQMVPSLGCTPPISPICLEDQEVMKLERKRARNRMAARKCRSRKLEQISLLEGRVGELKGQNECLAAEAASLRQHVLSLRSLLTKHLQTDCQLPASL